MQNAIYQLSEKNHIKLMGLNVTKNRVWTFYKWVLFIMMLDSLRAWFFWDLPIPLMVPILFILISIIVILLKHTLFAFKNKSSLIMLLFLLTVLAGTRGNLNGYIAIPINASGFLFFVGLKDNYKKDFLKFFTCAFSILMAISLFGWFLYLLGVSLPNFESFYGYSEIRNEAQYKFHNYYVFLTYIKSSNYFLMPRFSSIFLEPGYLGIILVILLYLNRFNLKNKYNIILLTALFFTFSLAGWLLGLLAYIAFRLKHDKKKFIVFVSIAIFMGAFYVFFNSYKDGDNVINKRIIERIQYDESKGAIAGYKRTSEHFDTWFYQSFLKSNDIWFGLDMYKIFGPTINVGWKRYMVNYGIVGLSLYLLFLFYIYYKHKNYDTLVLFFIYILIFVRGHDLIYWSAFPILYLCGSTVLTKANQIR